MNKTFFPEINLETTLLGGQSFSWIKKDDFYIGSTINCIVKLKKEGLFLIWQTYPEKDDFDFIRNYFYMDFNYTNMICNIFKDAFIKKAIKKYYGLRVLNQGFTETLMSFLLSSHKGIKAIRKNIEQLRFKFGKKVTVDDCDYYLFPEPEKIASTQVSDLLDCGTGFRARYLKEASKLLVDSQPKEYILHAGEDEARKELIKITGTGEKIADCILAFGAKMGTVTPLDVWGKRFCVQYYNLPEKTDYKGMRSWLNEYFGQYTSWAGQFLFEYIRNTGKPFINEDHRYMRINKMKCSLLNYQV
jgi:N-glycosylase/DNA lyase